MKGKVVSIIFTIILIAIVVVTGITIINKKEEQNLEDSGLSTEEYTEDELASLDDEQRDEQIALEEEWTAYRDALKNSMKEPETHTGEYKNYSVSIGINPDFITNKYHFRQIYTYNELEFLGYEEISDLSEYINNPVWSFTDEYKSCVRNGLINEDGTFNKVTQTIADCYGYFDYGEETVIENRDIVAVKLKIKYTNLSAKKLTLYYWGALQVFELMNLDDGKLYEKSSVYTRQPLSSFWGPVCTNMSEKYEDGELNITLNPKEEYIGEVIYLFLKEDLDDIYFYVDSGYHGGVDDVYFWQNFKSVGVHFLPLTELKKLEGK